MIIMQNFLERFEMLYGQQAVDRLKRSSVAVFGVGGVGSYAVEALARCGIGRLDLIDNDRVAVSNINRQLIATFDTVGRNKVDAAKERIASISPQCDVRAVCAFYAPDNADSFDLTQYDFVVDAVDFVPAKIELAVRCDKLNVPLISAMGAGNKIHPELFEVADIYKTSVCPLARVMRRELKKRGVRRLLCVYSKEIPRESGFDEQGKRCPASCAFVPSAVGLIIASQVVNQLTGN